MNDPLYRQAADQSRPDDLEEAKLERWYGDLMTLCGRFCALALRGRLSTDQRVMIASDLRRLADRLEGGQ